MLSTINGFDLLLVLIITGLIIWNRNLNRECESYVGQILQMSWDKQSEYDRNNPPYGYIDPCNYCSEVERRITGDECTCEIPF